MKHLTLGFAFAAILSIGALQAQVPQLVNYQGRVAADAVNFEGAGLFKFALVNADATVTFWSNDETSVAGSEPGAAVSLPVSKGLYSVLLGDAALANMAAIPAAVFTNPDVRLRVWFDDGVNGSQLLDPDQRLAPAAYLADGAVTAATITDETIVAAKIAPGTIDGTRLAPATLDFSHLLVPNAPGAGQVLGFDGVSLNWAAPGMGDGIWTQDGTLVHYTGGTVAIGTAAPNPGYVLAVNGGVQFTTGGLGGTLQFGTPNFETGMTITGTGRADVRFDGSTLKLVAGPPNMGPPSNANGITIDTSGNVGIGVLAPTLGIKLHVNGAALVDLANGDVQFGSPNGETGMTIIGTARADLRFDGDTVKLLAGPLGFVPGNDRGIAVKTNGNVGIGTTEPASKLDVSGDVTSTRLILRADPAAPANAAVLCANAGVTTFVPYNTATNRPLSLIVRDASVRVLTIYGGADLAEPFAMSERGVPAGAVVSIDPSHPGKLRMSAGAYDRKVAGIVSGANGIKPGISMIDEELLEAGENVALSGRVYVKANSSAGRIEPGDLLTTSEIPGEAMKAADHQRAQGSILGKAMTPLDQATGLVLVLVTLQ